MTDDPQLEDDMPVEPTSGMDDGAEEQFFEDELEGAIDTEAILADAALDRMHRKAYWHSNQKQLFMFLFANCLFFASAFAAWMRVAPGEAGDPSVYIRGLDTIRGSFIFALSIYGFWTAVFNIWHAQMKIWPYMLAAVLALWVGVSGFVQTIGGDEWDAAGRYLEQLESKKMLDDILVRMSVVAPGYWLLTVGGLVVVWVVVNGLMQGSQQSKTEAPAGDGGGSSRRKRR
jgi:hypothetical protein